MCRGGADQKDVFTAFDGINVLIRPQLYAAERFEGLQGRAFTRSFFPVIDRKTDEDGKQNSSDDLARLGDSERIRPFGRRIRRNECARVCPRG